MELRSRFTGCLLGGAVGDALGYPVEFMWENDIRKRFGKCGIRTLSQAGEPAKVSDDTQMSMFAANAYLSSVCTGEPFSDCIKNAYLAWLATQDVDYPLADESSAPWVYGVPQIHALRAPGNTCLNALRALYERRDTDKAENHSKGCGTVMRAAVYGLTEKSIAAELAAFDAELTHGHREARAASRALAKTVAALLDENSDDVPLSRIVLENCGGLLLVEKAVDLGTDDKSSDLEAIHALGEGWTAEEALAIAVFCAVRHENDFAAAIRAAVNHKGDSDSTGAVCGDLLGARLGAAAVETAFDIDSLEMADELKVLAEDLYLASLGADGAWRERYR